MELTFLTGPVPLTKTITFSSRSQSFTTSPYPMVQKVTSSVREVTDIHAFKAALIEEGRRGACLMKGSLDAPLVAESRASHTDSARLHDWVCFDFDGVDCTGVGAAVTKYFPDPLRHGEFLVQLSASAFRPDTRRFSGHLFALLDRAVPTQALHDWITWLNLHTALRSEIRLTESALGLHLPLDRTVASPAKLIYIAPPRCVGFEPRIARDEAIFILPGRSRTISLPTFTRVERAEESALINELRAAAGMPERTYATRTAQGQEFLIDADPCVVSDLRPSGDGYIRFNLNGGDSLAYFIDLRNPGVIGNFKGEPYLRTDQAAPDLHKALTKNHKAVAKHFPDCSVEIMAFYATNRQSTIYIGTYNRATDDMRLDPSNQVAAYAWLSQYGMALKPTLPHYDLTVDMTSDIRFEEGYPVINLFRQSDYLKSFANVERTQACDPSGLARLAQEAPLLMRIIRHVLGSQEEPALYFLNWLAAVFQRRTRTLSAWVMHGTQGTGKGLLVDYVIRPLFGEALVTQQNYSILKSNHNSYLEGKLFVVFNEADMTATDNWSEVRMKLYDYITEPKVCVNPKGKDERDVANHANFLFMSNKSRPVIIEDGDRRFNVGEFQGERYMLPPNELAALINQDQLPPIAKLLGEWQVNDDMLAQPYGGKAKEQIYEATHNLLDRVARAIREGDTEFFIDNRPDDIQLRTDYSGRILPIIEYDALIDNMLEQRLNVLTLNDLYVLFRMVAVSDKVFPETKAAQRQVYQRYGLLPEKGTTVRDKRTGGTVRGFTAPAWHTSDALKELVKKTDPTNVIKLRGNP